MAKREKTKQKQNKDKNMKNKKMFLSLLTAGGLVLAGATANANTISMANVSQVPAGTGTDWTYNYSFANSLVQAGDYFTISDFGLATAYTTIDTGWVMSQALLGRHDVPVPFDSATILNATFTWTGPDVDVGNWAGNNFSIHSAIADIGGHPEWYSTGDHASDDPVHKASFGQGQVNVPTQPDNRVPDGGVTIGMLGFALMGVEGLRRKLSK